MFNSRSCPVFRSASLPAAPGVERCLPALSGAGIDLHPHKVDAVVFAAHSPYRDGVILADEEGLGKTVEAGIVLLQAWLEDRRRLLVLCPPALIEHWKNELADKFLLPVRFIDDTTFLDDLDDFRARYMTRKTNRSELAERARTLCRRTLRRHAFTMPEIQRTVRTILTRPSPEEEALSRRLSLYFHRENLAAFPKVKEHHIRLAYWKILASSPWALHTSLLRLCERLAAMPDAGDEARELRALAAMAEGIPGGARSVLFAAALAEAREALCRAGASEKAAVFSGNADTLDFLNGFLAGRGYECIPYYGRVRSKRALLDFRRSGGRILLATDGAATGLDLSHCSLAVNYDLPWSIEKLEQRISRCHRYGQKHDVLVLNFIDPSNRANRWLYDSVNQKLRRFDELFGAGETLFGQMPVEDAPLELRSAGTIQADRETTVRESAREIAERVDKAEADLLAHFDKEVRRRFAKYGETVPAALSALRATLWN